jgi:hypothetical protein
MHYCKVSQCQHHRYRIGGLLFYTYGQHIEGLINYHRINNEHRSKYEVRFAQPHMQVIDLYGEHACNNFDLTDSIIFSYAAMFFSIFPFIYVVRYIYFLLRCLFTP